MDLVQDGASPVRKAAVEALMRLPVHLVKPHEAVIEKQKLLENIPGVLEACTTLLRTPPFSAHSKPGMGFGGAARLAGPGQGDVHAPAGGRGAGDFVHSSCSAASGTRVVLLGVPWSVNEDRKRHAVPVADTRVGTLAGPPHLCAGRY